MGGRIGFWLAHFNTLAISLVLLGAFGIQFGEGEMPCPLCVLQRMAMMLCAMGPVYVLLKARDGDVPPAELALGYGLSIVAAVAGATISGRQILLHILPGDPGYGAPALGLHLYTWAFVVFVVVILDAATNVILSRELAPRGVRYGWPTKAVVGLFGAIVLANAVSVFLEEGFHWTLPDDPQRYQLLWDLGWKR